MVDVLQWLVILIFAGTAGSAFYNLTNSRNYHITPFISKWVIVVNTIIVLQSLLYIFLQLDWIVTGIGKEIDTLVDTLWLGYDYFTGFALLSITRLIHVYLNWRLDNNCLKVYIRRIQSQNLKNNI